MNKRGKKCLAVILSVIMMLQLCCPVVFAEALESGLTGSEAAGLQSVFTDELQNTEEMTQNRTDENAVESEIQNVDSADEIPDEIQLETEFADMADPVWENGNGEILTGEEYGESINISEEENAAALASDLGEDPFGDGFISQEGEDETSGFVQLEQEKVVNPLYQGLVNPEDLLDVQESGIQTYAEPEYYTTLEPLAEITREGMKNRLPLIQLYFRLDTLDTSYFRTVIVPLAYAHTGVSTEGDYLRWGYKGYSASIGYFQQNGYYYYQLKATFTYYTTEEQEAELDVAVDQALQEMNLSGQTDYVKIKRIYDYICSHVCYDYDTLGDEAYTLKYTAYAAMINGTAVCQGYAALLYRMALSVGVDSRLIAGYGGTQRHGWNIAKVDGMYYNLDSTWDSSRTAYAYFLKAEAEFPGHTRDDEYTTEVFQSQYPMSEASYVVTCPGHVEEIMPAVEATCTKSGLTEGKKCSLCEAVLTKQTRIPALGHDEEVMAEGEEATCTESGLTEKIQCRRCGEVLQEQEEIPALGHNEEVTAEGMEATCTQSGLTEEIQCSRCGEVLQEQEEIPALGHEGKVTAEGKKATCTESGLTEEIQCSRCGEILQEQEEISALGHEGKVTAEGKEATCTDTGLSDEIQCTRCGEVLQEQEEISALGHDEEVTAEGKKATCTDTGLTEEIQCIRCGEVLQEQEEIPALGHEGKVTAEGKKATCTEGGLTEGSKCSRCGEVLQEQKEIPALGHMTETLEGKVATCTESGLTEGSQCSRCGEVLQEQEEIPALGHMTETLEGKVATCTESGLTEGSQCSRCGEVLQEQEEIPALGHMTETLEAKAATCTESGLTAGSKCSRCGEVLQEQEEIPALGHDFGAWVVTTKATVSADGVLTRTCTHDESHRETQTIYHPVSGTLSADSFKYNGKVQRPTVKTVKDSQGKVISSSNYDVTYSSGCKVPGTYSVKITFKGNYSGSMFLSYTILKGTQTITASGFTKTLGQSAFSLGVTQSAGGGKLSFKSSNTAVAIVSSKGNAAVKGVGTATITITAAANTYYSNVATKKITITVLPKGTTLIGLANTASRRMTVAWNRNTAVNGYQVQYSLKPDFTNAVTKNYFSNATVKAYYYNLTKGKGYYVRIRTFKKVGGKYYFSTWSARKGIVIRK